MQQLKTFFALILLALAMSVTSCHTAKHKRAKLSAAFDKLKAKADADADLSTVPTEKCASWYVPKVETKTTVKYLPGKPIKTTEVQYVTVDCDSVVKATPKAKDRIVRVSVPTYLQVDTTSILCEIDRENVAALAYKDSVIAAKDRQLNAKDAQIAVASDNNKALKADKSYWKGKAIWTWVGLVALLGLGIGYKVLKNQYVNKVKDLIG